MTDFSTNWGSFYIGQEVILSDEGKENDNYSAYSETVLIIEDVDPNDDGLGVKEPIISFICKDGCQFPFSLYGYEIQSI